MTMPLIFNTSKKGENTLDQAYESIAFQIQEDVKSFDVFFSLPSVVIWQSPMELSRIWIERTAPEGWKFFQEEAEDSEDMRLKKAEYREILLRGMSQTVYSLSKNPTILQKISTRLLIQETLIQDLSITDQDRIIAAELCVSYKAWQQILGVFSVHDELRGILNIGNLQIGRNRDGKTMCDIVTLGTRIPDQNIAGIIVANGKLYKENTPDSEKKHPQPMPISITHISNEVLERFSYILGMEQEKNMVRHFMLGNFQEVPVWKRRIGGGNSSEKKQTPEGKIAWQR